MEEQSETLSSKKEFAFSSSTILSQVGRGIIVGLVVGIIVGSFRFLIEMALCARVLESNAFFRRITPSGV